MKDVTFYKVTNKMIYDKICALENQVKLTNGKVKLNRWIAGMATTIALAAMAIRV